MIINLLKIKRIFFWCGDYINRYRRKQLRNVGTLVISGWNDWIAMILRNFSFEQHQINCHYNVNRYKFVSSMKQKNQKKDKEYRISNANKMTIEELIGAIRKKIQDNFVTRY